MGKILEIYLAKKDQPESSAYAALSFPAATYQIQDAFDKLRLTEGEALYWEITEYYQFEELSAVLNDTCGLYDLNALAQKLSELDETQRAAFSGLLAMEQKTKRPLPITRLIDLAYSTDCCHVACDALNDSQLGRIRAESGCVPGIDNLPKDVFEMLDFERIGRNIRISENGVFVERSMDHPGGYVARHALILEVAKTLDLTPKAPDYTILLEVFHDSGAVQLKLPASDQDLDGIPQTLDEPDWLDLSWRCLDCKVPSLMDAVSEARDIHAVNDFAGMLAQMNGKTLVIYKALLEARGCRDLLNAELLANQTPSYTFSPQISSPAELAKEELSVLLCKPEAETVLPYVNLQKYGEALIQKSGGELTGYGLIERTDGRPVLSPGQEQTGGGMTLHEIFHIRAFCSPNGTFREVELDLPATDYELLDALEQLQPEDGKRPYLEFHAVEEYDYLDKRIQETDLFRLNALAKRLAELDSRGMAAFEGLVCMDLQKGEKAIPIGSLIDYAHSGDCCHVVEEAVTDEELGRFLVENGFIPEAEDLSDETLKLLDFERIGREHREAEGGAFTGFGYVERHSELPRVYETMDFRSCKPPYTVLLNIGPFPNANTPGSRPKPIPVQLPASDAELQDVLTQLGKANWTGIMAAILDCPVPSMNKRLFLEDDISQVVEWAEALRALDEEGSLPKYKALLNAENCEDISKAVSLIDELDQYTFCPEYGSVSEVAKGQLHLILGEREAGMILPHLDLNGYGKDLIQYLGGAVTPYGFLEKRENAPAISEENQPQRGGMEMM